MSDHMNHKYAGDPAAKEFKQADPKVQLRKRIENDFSYHAPDSGQVARFQRIRDRAKDFAHCLIDDCPVSRELSVALTKLEEVVFAANSAIARNE